MSWFTLESVSGLVALESEWQRLLGEQFVPFRSLCLEPSSARVLRVPCPRRCGCNHSVILRHDASAAVGVCRCLPAVCPDIPLTLRQITPLEVSFERLGRGLCRAFGFDSRYAPLPPSYTFQCGSWSPAAVPAIVTLQVTRAGFRRAVAELAAQQRQPFILFGPTSDFLDAPARGMLEQCGAAFFDLRSHVLLTQHGTLQPVELPGRLFARFTPQPKELDLDVARRAFALVETLDTDKPLDPPSLLSVFRLYCIHELSAAQIAVKFECSKPTVLRRLALIRARTGLDPRQLRRLSPHMAKLEAKLHDPRAKRVFNS